MASWAPPIGDERLRPRAPTTPLSALLAQRKQVAIPGALPPQQAHQNAVSTPHALPPSIPFGSMPPGQAHSSHFTGGVSQNPVSLTQPQDQMFQGPTYPSMPQGTGYGGGASPGLSALSGGRSALMAALGSSGDGGGDDSQHPLVNGQIRQQALGLSGPAATTRAVNPSAVQGVPRQSSILAPPRPSGAPASSSLVASPTTLGAALAAAAQRGTKLRLPV